MLDEFAINAYHLGERSARGHACLKILERTQVPKAVATRAGALARDVMATMIDPVWGGRHTPYAQPFVPTR